MRFHFNLPADVALVAVVRAERSGSHFLVAGHALVVEGVHAGQHQLSGLGFMAGIAGGVVSFVLRHVHWDVARFATRQAFVEHVFVAIGTTLMSGQTHGNEVSRVIPLMAIGALLGFGFYLSLP